MIPTVFIPGLLCTAEVFAPQITALWPFGSVMVASTLEGRTIPEIAASILATAPPRFALAGISMGGYLCFEVMRQAPERVMRLALLDTSARPDTPEQSASRRAMVARAREGDFERLLAAALSTLLHPKHRDDARLGEINLRMGLAVGVDGFERQQEAVMARIDSRPGLAAISVPTLVLVGDEDPVTPLDRAEEMATGIPGARLMVVEECGHESTLEQPEAVNHALVEWIRS